MAEPLLAYNVFFTLADRSPERVQALVAACKRDLTTQSGIVYFACGPRDPGLDRAVNDTEFDVGLHIVFVNRAAHDAYQDDPGHTRFVTEQRANWSRVRVFDTLVESVPARA